MDKRLFNDFVRLLAENLDYIFIAIAVLFGLLIITSLFPKKKRIKLKGEMKPDKARKQLGAAASEVEALLAKYEERILYYEQLEAEKKESIQGLELAIAERDEALRNLEGAPEELQKVLASIDTSGKPRRRGRGAAFFWGMLFGILLFTIVGYAYANWAELQEMWEAWRASEG